MREWIAGVMRLSWLAALGVLLAGPVLAAPPCDAATAPGATCSCDVRTLRPLQGAVGQQQVDQGVERIGRNLDREWRKLGRDPIKVVRGPGGALFITDHHHGASAWLRAGHPAALCQMRQGPAFRTEAEFWDGLVAARLVHLEDEHGRAITPAQLPQNLAAMPDDPYRTFAGQLRRAGGFCRALAGRTEFVEFAWADWMRERPELPLSVIVSPSSATVNAAVALARTGSARRLAGWIGDKDTTFECPRDD